MAVLHKKQYWKLQNKQKRKNIFESADVFLDSAYEYFSWCDKNTCYKPELIKTGAEKGMIIEVPVQRPYSLSGFCAFWGWSQAFLTDFKNGCPSDFKDAIERIETIIETQQFEGAVIGLFNASVLGRKQNSVEQPILGVAKEENFGIEAISDVSKNELNKLLSKLQS